jgi:hypothetical protein
MSVQNKIDNEFSVLVDNISKIALAIERKGVHSSGELANYHSEIDSIETGSVSVITEDNKREIILEFVKSLGYNSPSDIKGAYDFLSETLGIVEANLGRTTHKEMSRALGLVGFVISNSVDMSRLTYRYTLFGADDSLYTSEFIHPENGVNCVIKTLPAYNDTLMGKDDERTLVLFLTDIQSVGNNLTSCKVEVFVNGNSLRFNKYSTSRNDDTFNVVPNVLGGYNPYGKRIKYYMDYDSSIVGDVLYRKLKYIYSLNDDETVLTTYMDSPEFYRDREMYTEDFGVVNNDTVIPSSVKVITSEGYRDVGGVYPSIKMSYDYVNSFVSKGYTYKFTPANVSLATEQGFVGMVDAKEPIGVTLWTGEVVVFPKGTNKYNLKTKTFETWDGQSYTQEDHL